MTSFANRAIKILFFIITLDCLLSFCVASDTEVEPKKGFVEAVATSVGRETKSTQMCKNPLLLTDYINSGAIVEGRECSRVLLLPNTDRRCQIPSYSGYFTVNNVYNSNLFFWFFQSIVSKNFLIYKFKNIA